MIAQKYNSNQEQIESLQNQILQLNQSIDSNQQFMAEMQFVDKYIQELQNILGNNLKSKTNHSKSDLLNNYTLEIQKNIVAAKSVPNNSSFNIKDHVHECLEVTEIRLTKEKIKQSKQQLKSLYDKISKYLQKEEPYISDKIFARIKNQVEGEGRNKLMKNIRKQQDKLKDWKQKIIDKAVKQSNLEQVGKYITQNVTLLTEIKNRKVLANDIMFSEIVSLQKSVQKLKTVPDFIDNLRQELKNKMFNEQIVEQYQNEETIQNLGKLQKQIEQNILKLSKFNSEQFWKSEVNLREFSAACTLLEDRIQRFNQSQ